MPDFYMPADTYFPAGAKRQIPTTSATEDVILGVCESFGISLYRLARILGAGAGTVYRWTSGERTPASVFLVRLAWLQLQAAEGLPIKQIDSILWSDSLILWRDRRVTKELHIPNGQGLVGDGFNAEVFELAQTLSYSRQHALNMNVRKGRDVIRTGD